MQHCSYRWIWLVATCMWSLHAQLITIAVYLWLNVNILWLVKRHSCISVTQCNLKLALCSVKWSCTNLGTLESDNCKTCVQLWNWNWWLWIVFAQWKINLVFLHVIKQIAVWQFDKDNIKSTWSRDSTAGLWKYYHSRMAWLESDGTK